MKTWLRRLDEAADESFRQFQQRLIPGADPIIGVRTPRLEKMAREIIAGDWAGFLAAYRDEPCYEIRLLCAFVIGRAKMPIDRRLALAAEFIPRIDNWAVCDLFCNRLKVADRDRLWNFVLPYADSPHPFQQRFAAVMMCSHFVDTDHAAEAFAAFERMDCSHYYVSMGVAWALSIYFVKLPDLTLHHLQTCRLDDLTYNRALQKIVESRRTDPATKERIRRMKRRKASR